jgi:serine/threonine protein kinase
VEVEEGYPNPGDSAPKYVVCPAEPDDDHLANAANLCVIDYGEAFDPLAPPEKGVGIPLPYCAPEILLEGKCGVASDIWALAATLFEIRTGYKLFSLCMNEVDDYLDLLVELLGPMPEPWWSTTWETRRVYWRDEADADGRAISATKRIVQSDFNILDQMRGNVLHFFMGEGQGWVRFPVPEEEKPIFEDLLKMMLRWKPEDRPSAEEVLKHPWFALEEEEVVQMEVEDGEFGDERSRDGSEDDETEDEMESDEEEDEEMSDAEMEVAQEANGESRSDQQEILKDNDKDDQKNENHELNHNQSHDPKDYLKSDQQEARKDNYGSDQKNDPKDDQKDDPKDDQKDDQQNVDEQVPYQRVEHMDCQQDDQDETPKPDSRVEKVKDNLLVSEKAGLLKVAVDTRFLAVAAWVKKTLRWSRK